VWYDGKKKCRGPMQKNFAVRPPKPLKMAEKALEMRGWGPIGENNYPRNQIGREMVSGRTVFMHRSPKRR